MNSIKKVRNLDTFPRVRKRNSVGNKPSSHGTLNAAQRRASLLKNNKNLALTLQETRCELSVYKNFFEDCREYMNKTKLAKSRMVQLSAALKNFVKAFDENILLLDFDESKWPNIKASAQPNKNFQNGMNPVIELCDEILEDVCVDQEMNCDENNPEHSDPMVTSPSNTLQKAVDDKKCFDRKRASKSLRKKTEDLVENKKGEPYSEIGNSEGNEDILREASNFSQKKCPNANSVLNPPPAPLSSQALKNTKIPRCKPLSVTLKRQNLVKDSKPLNKASKRKSFDKKYEESDPSSSRRKTFVVMKSNNVLREFQPITNAAEENGQEKLSAAEDELISINDKRKTFVLKSSHILKETEPALYSDQIDKEIETESRDSVNETTDVQCVLTLEKNKRKTFVKKKHDKIVLHQNNNDAEYQVLFPIRECAVNLEPVENFENSDQLENIKSSSDFHHPETLTGFATVKNEQIFAESSKKVELSAEVDLLNRNMISDVSSKESMENDKVPTTNGSDASDNTEITTKNLKSKSGSVRLDRFASEAAEKDVDIMNERVIFNDKSQVDTNSNKLSQLSPVKTRRSFLESSESEIDLFVIDEFDYGDKRPAFKTTPIRRKIDKSKKKKFVFDGNKRNSVLKNQLSSEILNSEVVNQAGSQKDVDTNHSDVNAINNNEINTNEIRDGSDVVFISDDNPINVLFETDTVKKKTKKTSSRKIKSSQTTSIKNNTEKNSIKSKKVKNNKKNGCSVEIDDLISQPKRNKKKNIKKKKKDNIYDDTISKFVEVDKIVQLNEVKETETGLESDFPCKKTGKNTFLVRAEIHPPPPSLNMPEIKETNKEDDKLNLQHMQAVVVLNDVFKSKDNALLNKSDRDLLCSRAVSLKSLSGSSSSFVIDPEESIEKLRCDPLGEADDCDLHSDAILDIGHSEADVGPVFEIENPRVRRKKPIIYKEPSLKKKVRR